MRAAELRRGISALARAEALQLIPIPDGRSAVSFSSLVLRPWEPALGCRDFGDSIHDSSVCSQIESMPVFVLFGGSSVTFMGALAWRCLTDCNQ